MSNRGLNRGIPASASEAHRAVELVTFWTAAVDYLMPGAMRPAKEVFYP
jgi:hypothetical protein